jgi:hypothetical protein
MAAFGMGDQEPPAVHVIVTCTNRKTLPVPGRLRLGSIRHRSPALRARAWIRQLAESDGAPLIAARDLYAGEHWMVARSLPDRSGGRRVRLWTCSAGYGLIPADAHVRPYSATFSGGHADSAPGGADGSSQWWRALSEWEGPAPGQPRSLGALVETDPGAVFVLALSAPYLNACRTDIDAASQHAADPEQIMVISVGTRQPGRLGPLMVPADARLQAHLGGTRQALNARVAAYLLTSGMLNRAKATRHLAQLLAQQPPIPRYDRKKLTDREILGLIADGLARSPGASAARMLREFRDAGYACEQQRFGQLHRSLTENQR